MTKYCYLNGKILPLEKAGISLRDIGILRGYGIFDFSRTYNGKPFAFKEHFMRMKHSANVLNLKVPIFEKETEEIIKKLISKNKLKEANIRMVLTGGESLDGISYHSTTFYILVGDVKKFPESIYKKGAKLITYEYLRDEASAKTLNYITAIKLQPFKKRQKAFEILYTYKGYILEATTSNFFIFKKDNLITPKENILYGITRNYVIKLAKDIFKIEERAVSLKELDSATEAFITSTNKEIVPVVKIDNKIIGNGKVGKNTKKLIEIFHLFTQNY